MRRPLTRHARIRCQHETGGTVQPAVTQHLVRIEGAEILLRSNSLSRPVSGCIVTPPMKPCLVTIAELSGWSSLLFVEGQPVLQDDLDGLTSGDPPGTVHYRAAAPGQSLVRAP